MPFPESQRVVYQKNPLTQVSVQLHFPPILSIVAGEPAAIQERIRDVYPLYSQQPVIFVPPQLADFLQKLRLPQQAMQHVFLTADEMRTATLAKDFLALVDKHYARWENFRHDVGLLRTALEEVYHPAFYSRVGLRYIDTINKQELGLSPDEDWATLINPTLLGLLGDTDLRNEVEETVSSVTLSIPNIPGGTVRLQHGLRPTGATKDRSEVAYTIDVDLFTQVRTNSDDVAHTLDVFNQLAGNLFRWSITPKLSGALEPVPLAPVGAGAR